MRATETEARRQFAAAQERGIGSFALEVRTRFVEFDTGLRLQLLEVGDGDPLVMLHGTGAFALTMLPLAEHLPRRRVLIVDRPGHGLSDPVGGLRERPRTTAVDVVVGLLDALGLDRVDLAGSSGGGLWALWTGLDQPQRVRRIVLAGGTPALPGTRVPLPLKLMVAPAIGDLLDRVMPQPSPKTVRQFMAMMGEGNTIGRHPAIIDGLVATGNDPIATQASRQEMAGIVRGLLGWRPSARFTETELRRIDQPTLLIWGDHDPIGTPDVARAVAKVIPHGEAVEVPAGHVPYFGHPERTAELISHFLDKDKT